MRGEGAVQSQMGLEGFFLMESTSAVLARTAARAHAAMAPTTPPNWDGVC